MNFNETEHTYRKDGRVYTSVSDFLRKFKPEFPKGLMAEKCAQKEGKAADEIIAKWDLNSEISSMYGTTIHKAIEYWIRYGESSKLPHIKKAVDAFASKHDREVLVPEIIVYNETYGLAGTIDQLKKLGDKRLGVIDVKTNGELTDNARGYFLGPLKGLPFSKMNEYRLQLSTYKFLLELKGFTVDAIELEHWNGSKFTTIPLEPIDVEPLCQTLLGGTGEGMVDAKIRKTVRI